MTSDDARRDNELDELLHAVRARFTERSDATFDFEAGLADVRERTDLPFARVPARRPRVGPGPASAAVALACEHLDDLVVALGCLLLPGAFPDLIGSQIQRAADVLLALHGEIQAGTASSAGAASALTEVRDALEQADLVIRVELGTPLAKVLGDASLAGPGVGQEVRLEAASRLERLERELTAALAETGDQAAVRRRSAPARRGDGAERRRRSAGGG